MADQAPLKLVTGSPNKVKRFASGDTIAPVVIGVTSGVVVGTTMTQTLTNKTVTDPKINRIFAANDSTDPIAEMLGTASAVNHLVLQNNVTTQSPRIIATGTDANIGIALQVKGSGTVSKRIAGVLHELVDVDSVQSISGKALVAPGIADFSNAQHAHTGASSGGLLTSASFAAGSGVPRVLFANTASSAAVANTTTTTVFDISPYAMTWNQFAVVGQLLRITAAGKFSTTGTPNMQIRLRSSSPAASLHSLPLTTPAGVTDQMWGVQFLVCVRGVGAVGPIFTQPLYHRAGSSVSSVAIGNPLAFDFPTNGATATNLQLDVTWSAADPANTVTLETWVIEALN